MKKYIKYTIGFSAIGVLIAVPSTTHHPLILLTNSPIPLTAWLFLLFYGC